MPLHRFHAAFQRLGDLLLRHLLDREHHDRQPLFLRQLRPALPAASLPISLLSSAAPDRRRAPSTRCRRRPIRCSPPRAEQIVQRKLLIASCGSGGSSATGSTRSASASRRTPRASAASRRLVNAFRNASCVTSSASCVLPSSRYETATACRWYRRISSSNALRSPARRLASTSCPSGGRERPPTDAEIMVQDRSPAAP